MAPVSSMVTGEGASAYAAGSQVWNGISGTFTAKPASTPMASQGITGPRCAVTICVSAPDAAMAASWPKSIVPAAVREERWRGTRAAAPPIRPWCRRRTAWPPDRARGPPHKLDEEECGNEAQLPEQKPVEEIERGEGAEEARLKHQHQAEEQAGHMVHAVRRINRHERDDGREHQHQRAEAVDAEMILNAQRRRPGDAFDQADAAVGGQVHPDEQAQRRGRRAP